MHQYHIVRSSASRRSLSRTIERGRACASGGYMYIDDPSFDVQFPRFALALASTLIVLTGEY